MVKIEKQKIHSKIQLVVIKKEEKIVLSSDSTQDKNLELYYFYFIPKITCLIYSCFTTPSFFYYLIIKTNLIS